MKQKDLQKAEFWIATTLYLFTIVMLVSRASNRSGIDDAIFFQQNHIGYSHFYTYFLPELFRLSAIYFSFLLLLLFILPQLFKKEKIILNGSLVFILLIILTSIFGVAKTYRSAYELVEYDTLQQAYNHIFFKSFNLAIWLIILSTAYFFLRVLTIYLIENRKKSTPNENQFKADIGIGLAFWFVGLLLCVTSGSGFEISLVWSLVIFSSISIVIYSLYYLLPLIFSDKSFSKYFWQIFFISLMLSVPISLICLLFFNRIDEVLVVLLFHLPTQLLISAPLAWFIYKKRLANNNELKSLRTDLGKSDATLSFLQSQINPHFLFNALNTLYGTALQEKAERTGEGIQKLGDMMRFMLHENVQDKISLTRDVDYLENYIALQKLRTSRSADIVIETQIDEQLNNLEITPMLLIPFVENAFKHGISLQRPSHIKITLQTKENTLYFDVHNSINIKLDNDPEKLKSGIGLQNVKQRLALLYPGKHELIIRESAKEFFIHLTIEL